MISNLENKIKYYYYSKKHLWNAIFEELKKDALEYECLDGSIYYIKNKLNDWIKGSKGYIKNQEERKEQHEKGGYEDLAKLNVIQIKIYKIQLDLLKKMKSQLTCKIYHLEDGEFVSFKERDYLIRNKEEKDKILINILNNMFDTFFSNYEQQFYKKVLTTLK